MAKKRRKKGQQSKKEIDEKSKNFGIILAVILGLMFLVWIALRSL